MSKLFVPFFVRFIVGVLAKVMEHHVELPLRELLLHLFLGVFQGKNMVVDDNEVESSFG